MFGHRKRAEVEKLGQKKRRKYEKDETERLRNGDESQMPPSIVRNWTDAQR